MKTRVKIAAIGNLLKVVFSAHKLIYTLYVYIYVCVCVFASLLYILFANLDKLV